MIAIKNIEIYEDYVIKLNLIDKSVILYDMKPKLSSARFIKLQDKELFLKGKLINNNHIEWGNEICIYDYEIINIKNFIHKYMT